MRSHGDLILRPDPPQQQRRIRVVALVVFQSQPVVRVGVAVSAPVDTGVVSAYIPAFDTVAARSHATVARGP